MTQKYQTNKCQPIRPTC